MPVKNPIYYFAILLLAGGCGNYHKLPNTWHLAIPGVYEGTSGGYTERIEFRSNGEFVHSVLKERKEIYAENGLWSTSPGRFVIELSSFREFYDPRAEQFSVTPTAFSSYEFRPLPNGGTFSEISASVQFKFRLKRKEVPKG